MTPVGFEPTQLALVELESTPLDHSGKVSWSSKSHKFCPEHPPSRPSQLLLSAFPLQPSLFSHVAVPHDKGKGRHMGCSGN